MYVHYLCVGIVLKNYTMSSINHVQIFRAINFKKIATTTTEKVNLFFQHICEKNIFICL